MITDNDNFFNYLNNNIGKRGIIDFSDGTDKELIESNYKLFYYYIQFMKYLCTVNSDNIFEKIDFETLI